MWGYPGNLIKAHVKVVYSSDADCQVGTHGKVVMYASYNGVRSDSIQFFFPAACRDQDQLYHGPQVDAQVPPLQRVHRLNTRRRTCEASPAPLAARCRTLTVADEMSAAE